MNYDQALESLFSLYQFGSKLGLSRMKRLMDLLGNPQDELRFVHIAGTNGKGSTTTMLASILQAAGYKTGRFISPFVVDFRERMQVDGQMISQEHFARIMSQVWTKVEQMWAEDECPTVFEVTTAVAFCYFAQEQCDIVCLEVGLGGRLDATNIIKKPLVSVITSISLDHTRILGDTVEQIAGEKCGIIKEGGVTVSYPFQPPGAGTVIQDYAEQRHNLYVNTDMSKIREVALDLDKTVIAYGDAILSIPLPGKHQVYNAATVLTVVEQLRKQNYHIDEKALIDGMAAAHFPARLEHVSVSPDIVIDGAHNPDAARVLADYLKQVELRPKVLLLGMLGDKDYEAVIAQLVPLVDHVVLTTPKMRRAVSGKELEASVQKYSSNVYVEGELEAALKRAVDLSDEKGIVIISGSLFLASDMRQIITKKLNIRQYVEKNSS